MGIEIVKTERNRKIIAYNLPSYLNKDDKKIGNKIDDFEILQVLGEGSFGFVAKVKSKINFKIYALKKADYDKLSKSQKDEALNELIMLKFFDHPNVCNCLTSFEQDKCQYIVMHLFNNKDLFQYLSANCHLRMHIKEENIWNIFYQCLEGLIYIHKQGVIHRDIKPGNIFMDDKGNIKIGDFGISAVMDLNEAKKFTNNTQEQKKLLFKKETKKGTENFMAPEVEMGEIYDQKADVYSMGVCFYCLCYYNLPYINGNNMSEFYSDNLYSPELKKIIYNMILKDKRQRPNSMDIYGLFMDSYINKYVKNSGLCSVVQCLFNFPNFLNFFTDEKEISSIMKAGFNKKISLIMISVVKSIRDNANIEKNIYALRKILNEEGISKKDNEEISPLTALCFIIKSLNNELDDNKNKREPYKDNYLHNPDIPGEEIKKYTEFKNNYNFNSFISHDFSGSFKIKRQCYNKNHKNYMFRIFNYIPFNCDILSSQVGNNVTINIYKCFEIYNQKSTFLNLQKKITCPDCKALSKHDETKLIYETPQNLIITFERGKKSRNLMIEFNEVISFNKSQVQKNPKNKYYLMGVIAENNFNVKNIYSFYLKREKNWLDERGQKINFNNIKSNLNVVCLFYYQDLNDSGNSNISNNNINNYNQVNTFLNRYIYKNINNMNLDNIKRMTNKNYQLLNNNVKINENIYNKNNLLYMNHNRYQNNNMNNNLNNNNHSEDNNKTNVILQQNILYNNNENMNNSDFNQMADVNSMNNINNLNNMNNNNFNINNYNNMNNLNNNMNMNISNTNNNMDFMNNNNNINLMNNNNNNINFMNNNNFNINFINNNNNNLMNNTFNNINNMNNFNNSMKVNNNYMMNTYNNNNNNIFNGIMNNQINNNAMGEFNLNNGHMQINNNYNNIFNYNNNLNNNINNNIINSNNFNNNNNFNINNNNINDNINYNYS